MRRVVAAAMSFEFSIDWAIVKQDVRDFVAVVEEEAGERRDDSPVNFLYRVVMPDTRYKAVALGCRESGVGSR
ncbi:MAG: hypothetical protein ACRD2I_27575, partial [Vicinamibacterales bacterium]